MQVIRKIDVKLAAMIITAMFSCVVVFHVLVLSGVVSYKFVWGGRLQNAAQMYVFETVSLAINLAVIFIVGIRAGYIRSYLPNKLVTVLLSVLVILFALNTLGNLFAESRCEMILFTPFTLISAVLFYRMAIEY